MPDQAFECTCRNMILKLLDPSHRLVELVTLEIASVLKESFCKVEELVIKIGFLLFNTFSNHL